MVQWDGDKAAANVEKHGVDFADAVSVLSDDMALTAGDADAMEERYVTLGMDVFGRILVVAYTWREDDLRIISARKANRSEARQYEGER